MWQAMEARSGVTWPDFKYVNYGNADFKYVNYGNTDILNTLSTSALLNRHR
jgi:hypothetical protein